MLITSNNLIMVVVVVVIIVSLKKIMIINDRDDINFTIKMVLEEDSVNKEIRLYPFTDPFFALEHFTPGLYDLILVDRMPKMDGFELCSKIRKLDNKVKVCFLTASDISEVLKKEMFAANGKMICWYV